MFYIWFRINSAVHINMPEVKAPFPHHRIIHLICPPFHAALLLFLDLCPANEKTGVYFLKAQRESYATF